MINGRILIVEDEGIIAEDLRQTLIRSGYEVIGISATGNDAIERAHSSRPGLVSMDISIQGAMDGIEAAERIRSAFDIPIIFMSSTADDKTKARARAISPWFLTKPFDENELLSTAAQALALANTRSS